jgi:hypothetical protein
LSHYRGLKILIGKKEYTDRQDHGDAEKAKKVEYHIPSRDFYPLILARLSVVIVFYSSHINSENPNFTFSFLIVNNTRRLPLVEEKLKTQIKLFLL